MADGMDFFIHPQGKTHPDLEYQETLKKFLNEPDLKWGKFKQELPCAFPERYRFIKEVTHLPLKEFSCQQFNDWKKGIAAESITLVFSTSYPNNPASLFGHSFLRFNQVGKKNDLLDYGAAYSAEVDNRDWAPVYAYKGLWGGYPGRFEFNKYYELVNTYNNAESRDLWEFDLAIEKDGVDRILNHMWEIYSTTWFDYYFLDENCSLILGSILELYNPDWQLSESGRPYYLPHDLVKLVAKIPGLIKKVNFRPSIKKLFLSKYRALDSHQKEMVHNFYSHKEQLPQIQNTDDVAVLETLASLLHFKKFKNKGDISPFQKKLLRSTLMKRSQLNQKVIYDIPSDYVSNRPDLAHNPRRLQVGAGIRNTEEIGTIGFRVAYHDLMDPDAGVVAFSQFEAFTIKGRYQLNQNDFILERIGIVSITSLHNTTFYDPQSSWKVSLSWDSLEGNEVDNCKNCHQFQSLAGAGFSIDTGSNYSVLYIMAGLYSGLSEHFSKGHHSGPWLEGKYVLAINDRHKLSFGHTIKSNFQTSMKDSFITRTDMAFNYFANQNVSIGFQSRWNSRAGRWTQQSYQHELILGWFF